MPVRPGDGYAGKLPMQASCIKNPCRQAAESFHIERNDLIDLQAICRKIVAGKLPAYMQAA